MFDDFWLKYPRKEAKKDSFKAWGQITEEQRQQALKVISLHVARWEALGTEKTYIPLAASWLRGWRFDDEIEMPKPKIVEPQWWSSEAGILNKANEIGFTIRPGMSWFEAKNKINELLRKQA